MDTISFRVAGNCSFARVYIGLAGDLGNIPQKPYRSTGSAGSNRSNDQSIKQTEWADICDFMKFSAALKSNSRWRKAFWVSVAWLLVDVPAICAVNSVIENKAAWWVVNGLFLAANAAAAIPLSLARTECRRAIERAQKAARSILQRYDYQFFPTEFTSTDERAAAILRVFIETNGQQPIAEISKDKGRK